MNEFLRRLLFLPNQASTFAQDIDKLHFFVILTTLAMSMGVGLTAIFFFIRYRRRSEHQTTPHIESTVLIEVLFVTVPMIFFLTWFFLGYTEYIRQATPPADAMDVYVQGKKWMWKFAYPDGPNAVNVLRVPAGKPVRLLMTSRDVIHSFYVPEFRIKQDVLPGRYSQTWFQALEPGHYQILCSQYCGAGHSVMRGEVIALKPEDYEDWLHAERRGLPTRQDSAASAFEPVGPLESTLVEQGKRIAASAGCLKCHSIDGAPHIGPTWLDLYHRKEIMEGGEQIDADEGYITQSIMDPGAKIVSGYKNVMPSFQGKLAAPEVAALVEYIKSLQTDPATNGPPGGPAYAPITGR